MDNRLAKACPVCKAALGGKCLEKIKDGSKYIDEPHQQRYTDNSMVAYANLNEDGSITVHAIQKG